MEAAKDLYGKLKEHRYQENKHRTVSEEQALQDARDFEKLTEEMVAAHPELGEDGVPANKVLALMDVYRQDGTSAADALKQAVADLYPEAPNSAVAETPVEVAAPEVAPPEPKVEEPMIPPMEAYQMRQPVRKRFRRKNRIHARMPLRK
jgi:hypothetical protein